MTAADTAAAMPDLVSGTPRVVRGTGVFGRLVFGRDGDSKWFFRADGEGPDVPVDADVALVAYRAEQKRKIQEELL